MIRAADTPVRPVSRASAKNPGQVSGATRPAVNEPAEMYVVRDTSEAPATAAPGQGPDERDASYWYDLSGAGNPPGADDPPRARGPVETRGPFEPLVSSSGPQRMTPAPDSSTAQAGADHDGAVTPDHPGVPGSAGGEPGATHEASVLAEQPRVW